MEAQTVVGPVEGDAFGRGLLALLDGREAEIVIERDDGLVEVDSSSYVSDVDDSEMWRWLRARLGHRVLDIGAGGGRAAVPLQHEGLDVVALDISMGAVEVCSRRGLKATFVGSVEDLAVSGPEPFDSFLCFGNNLALLGSPASGSRFFDALRMMSREGARLVGTMLDPYATDSPLHAQYHQANRAAGRMPGQTRLRVRYQRLATPWFELLWLSPDELTDLAQASHWEVTDVLPGPIYCAELQPR